MKSNPMLDIQNMRLTEQEFTFCGKLNDKIQKIRCVKEADRQTVLDAIQKECNKKKYPCSFNEIDSEPNLVIYEFNFNDKKNYIVFDKAYKQPVHIVPSGVVITN